MKFFASTVAILAACGWAAASAPGDNHEPNHHRMLNAVVKPLPMMSFFVPLQEQQTFDRVFKMLGNQDQLSAPMIVMLSVTISTDKTVIWYDQWEDGFDIDVASSVLPVSKTTQVWGDGNAANGCGPHIAKDQCTNINDILNAGTSIVVQNEVPLPRNKDNVVFDGGDRIQASFPVAVTRASFPKSPGSVMAGAVEVYDTTSWGTIYEAPVGAGTLLTNNTDPFQIVGFSCLAGEDNTKVTMQNGTVATLAMGQSIWVPVVKSDQVKSDKPIQVVLLALDRLSTYETRWFTMRPLPTFEKSYVSPVGDSYANTAIVVYNPGPNTLTYTVSTLVNKVRKDVTATLNAKQAGLTGVIPTGSGALLVGNEKFLALSITDSNDMTNFGQSETNGDRYDWGLPLVPRNELTSQVLVGLGYGCTNNFCDGRTDRNPIWLTPMEDADIYIDFKNTGVNQVNRTVNFLESIIITDPTDKDMSGASIFAVARGEPKDGRPVDIAVAWGQNPSVSDPDQSFSLDMGTVVPPFSLVKVGKTVDKAIVNPGEELTYTIRVSNVGHKDLPANALTVNDILDSLVTYVPLSTKVSTSAGSVTLQAVPDGASGTAFPLDEAGYVIPVALPRRGGTVEITFKVKTAASLDRTKIVNRGTVTQVGGGKLPFEAFSTVNLNGAIVIENTVYTGKDGGVKCGTPAAVESITGFIGSAITYCYTVKNTGKTHLSSIQITTAELNYTKSLDGILAPGASRTVFIDQMINATLTNNALAVGKPVTAAGANIVGADQVMSTDPSNVVAVTPVANVNITNVVYLGNDNGASCSTGKEKVSEIMGSKVVYCFSITNVGQTHLNTLLLKNKHLDNFERSIPETLAPGQKITISVPGTITMDLDNIAEVTGMPVLADGKPIPGLGEVKSSDPSGVTKLSFKPSIKVENTVYLGKDGGKQCGTPAAVEYVSGIFGLDVQYCIRVTNTGETHLSNVQLVDELLKFPVTNLGTLAPGASVMRFLDGKIDVDLKNFANATGNPIMADGRDIPDLADVKASDPSEVDRENSSPKIAIENTVLIGHDGASCGTSAAKEYVEDFTAANVTYCFTVKNSGNTYLDSIKINNPTLGVVDVTVPRLAPGVAATVPVFRTITGKFENEANVRANPTTVDGTDVPNAPDVTAVDKSGIGEIVYKPEVKIANTVYLGDNEQRSCGTAVEKVEGLFSTDVTYCFNVTNSGNSHLDSIRIGNDVLAFQDQTTIKSLAPGASAIVTVLRKITSTIDNSAKVTARPIRQDKSPLPMGDVSHMDPSSVVRIPHKPSVAINNTVYVGAPGSCSKGVDLVRDIFQTNVVYCLRVTNMGDTHLNGIKVADLELKVSQTLSRVLAPGESELISVPGQIIADLENKAVVTANPVLKDGSDIPDIPDVSAEDKSKVEKQVFTANVVVANTVYLGHDGGKSCGTSGESAQGLYGSNATFCFTVKNTGQTHLRSLTLSNVVLGYNEIPTKTLAPGESVTLTSQGKILSTQSNLVNVSATPITETGRDILDLPKVQATDPSAVQLVKHSPVVTIANTVYLGNDGGKSCATSQESVSEQFGKAVTYCFTITNNGNSHLNSIQIVNEKLGYSNGTTINLAPGASTLLTTTGKISASMSNSAIVTATPSMPDGTQIPNHDKVNANDPSSVVVVAHKSGINIENTVYLGGSDGGAKCSTGMESVSGYPNTGVMYCFEIKNVGESHLKDIVIKNVDLNLTDSSIKLLAPLETKVVAISRMITKDLLNTATATGTPALSDGTTIANTNSVVDSDTSAVDQLEYAPKVTIENSVYVGRSSDNLCGTDAARDGVDGIHGTAVTYCFAIKNTGNTPLKNVVIGNVNLDNYNSPVKDLAVNETVVVPLEKTITVDLKNTAVVTATPTITGLAPVSSKDDSMVNKLDFVPGVKIVNKVYEGSGDNGAKCGTDAAIELVEGVFGSDVVYCFTVTNTGDTHLADIALTNDKLGYKKNDFAPLAPGQSITVSLPGKITTSLDNLAVVTGNPTTASGQDIPDLTNVNSEDPSGVKKLDVEALVTITNTVYLGKDGGVQCGTPAAGELASDRYGANVTFCITVSNPGKTYLKNVVVENPVLGFADKSIVTLAPGANKTFVVEGTIVSSVKNVATVSGIPSLKDGTIIPDMDKVVATDPSAVERIPHAPRIEIDNLVVLGPDAAKCDTSAAVDYVEHYAGAIVTYCFEVTNKGDTHLSDIKIENVDLKFTDTTSIKVLAPGESAIVAVPSKIVGSLKNVAVVTGNPTLPSGKDIPDTPDATWSDGSAVGVLEYKPAVKVDNVVYTGDDMGASCAAKGVEKVTDKINTKVVYCFTVTNTGDTYLNNIQLVNPELDFTDGSIAILAPKETKLIAFSSSIPGNLTNNVVVTANPSLADGMDISGAQDVTSTDSSAVALSTTYGTEKETPKTPYSPPKNTTESCLQDKWTSQGKNGTLLCSTKQVFVETIKAKEPLMCKAGEKVTVTVDASLRIDGPRNDLGWYVAADGGDALTGTCIVNGLQSRYTYPIVDATSGAPAGKVVWLPANGGDDDTCGDVVTDADKVRLNTPLLVDAVLPCKDENGDGVLDVALCFTWRSDGRGACASISDNIPGSDCSCYCTRYDIVNVRVDEPTKVC